MVTPLLLLALLAVGTTEVGGQETADTTLPLTYPALVVPESEGECPSDERQQELLNQIETETDVLLDYVLLLTQGNVSDDFPCSGENWTRIGYLDMTDRTQHCPPGWREYTTPRRLCGRRENEGGTCDPVVYGVSGMSYSKVCGRIIAYQYGSPDAFSYYTGLPALTVNSNYVDGVSLTQGEGRNHIWTFAAGNDETDNSTEVCPCTNPSNPETISVPSFVGANYFCEAGTVTLQSERTFHLNDPLWDGLGCGTSSSCCSYNSPPWFVRELATPTTDYLEVRICSSTSTQHEDTPIERIDIYVQ